MLDLIFQTVGSDSDLFPGYRGTAAAAAAGAAADDDDDDDEIEAEAGTGVGAEAGAVGWWFSTLPYDRRELGDGDGDGDGDLALVVVGAGGVRTSGAWRAEDRAALGRLARVAAVYVVVVVVVVVRDWDLRVALPLPLPARANPGHGGVGGAVRTARDPGPVRGLPRASSPR